MDRAVRDHDAEDDAGDGTLGVGLDDGSDEEVEDGVDEGVDEGIDEELDDELDERERRSVVPARARRTPWLAAVWTGLGAVVVCAIVAIVSVAVCWLPVSGSDGRTNSAIRAGLLTLLASVHGGVTVDGVATSWVPLGMTAIVGLVAWRAGCGLADAAAQLDERDRLRLVLAGLAQTATFTAGCLVAVPFATLGTSRAPFVGVALGAFVLFALTGGVAFVWYSPLHAWARALVPPRLVAAARAGSAAVAAYLTCGAVLVATSLALHYEQVETLSGQVGGGVSGLPVLALGLLAVPNSAIAASAYLAGPGFALGSGTDVTMFGAAHGTLPAFPVLGAVPGAAAGPVVLVFAALTVLAAGGVVARAVWPGADWTGRFLDVLAAAVAAGVVMFLLGWLGGGAVGDGRLATIGASPWRLGGAVAVLVAVGATLVLGVTAAWRAVVPSAAADDTADVDALLADLAPLRRTPRLVIMPPKQDDDETVPDARDDDTAEAG